MALNLNAPIHSSRGIPVTFVYTGTDAVKEGEPFVYDITAGKAAEPSGLRHNSIKRPSAATDQFAGVAARSYPAETSGYRKIELFVPGSFGVGVRVSSSASLGAVATVAFKTGGSKTFKVGSTATTAVGIGDVIIRQTVSAAGLAQADICVAPIKACVAE